MHKRLILPTNNENKILYISETSIDGTFKATQHSHQNLELIFFTDGEGEVITPNKKYKVSKNDLMIINSSIKHYESSSTKLKFYAIGINNLYYKYANTLDNIFHYNLDKTKATKIHYLYDLIYLEVLEKKDNYINLINSLVELLNTIICRDLDIVFENKKISENTSLIESCKQYIDNYYYENININSLAKSFSVSVSYLCHKFKKETNYTLIEYKIKNQIDEAKNLLLISDMSISEISDSVGFTSSSYFNKIFKKYTNVTPKMYRKNRTKS